MNGGGKRRIQEQALGVFPPGPAQVKAGRFHIPGDAAAAEHKAVGLPRRGVGRGNPAIDGLALGDQRKLAVFYPGGGAAEDEVDIPGDAAVPQGAALSAGHHLPGVVGIRAHHQGILLGLQGAALHIAPVPGQVQGHGLGHPVPGAGVVAHGEVAQGNARGVHPHRGGAEGAQGNPGIVGHQGAVPPDNDGFLRARPFQGQAGDAQGELFPPHPGAQAQHGGLFLRQETVAQGLGNGLEVSAALLVNAKRTHRRASGLESSRLRSLRVRGPVPWSVRWVIMSMVICSWGKLAK